MGCRVSTLNSQQQKNDKIDQAKDRILREANEKARVILQEAKEVADETIRDFNKAGADMDIRDLEKKRQKVRDKINVVPGDLLLFFFNGNAALFQIRNHILKAFLFFADLLFCRGDNVVGQAPKPQTKGLDPKKLRKGDTVRIISMGLKGTVSTHRFRWLWTALRRAPVPLPCTTLTLDRWER